MGLSALTSKTRVLERPGAAPVLSFQRARLEIVRGPDKGRAFSIDRPALSVGSDPRCDLVLGDPAVSAVHFELRVDGEGCLLRDPGSTNGTSVDGYRAREIYLRHGAEIVAGETTLRFLVDPDEVELALSSKTNLGDLLGHSLPMRAAFAILERAAPTDATVLISGESGTGKELAARALHQLSQRRDGPFLVFDCGAAAPSLIESQLFGHARGAFTGAGEVRLGVFEEAQGGTLVLDEIGELPLELQPKLLRAVEARTITRLGETQPRSIDVRLVASTHRNLEEEVRAGRFRQDLYYRLSVLTVRLPALRERLEEIPRLVRHFMSRLRPDQAPAIPPAILEVLMSYTWPGNVRELRNVAERMLILPDLDPSSVLPAAQSVSSSSVLPAVQLASPSSAASLAVPHDVPFHEAKQQWTERFEREYLARLLEKHGGNVTEVARASGLSRQSCYRLIEKFGLRGT
ncbi:MAG: sigma 54-interacting transcriptional regulator [Deltaproteobacteria bacterium]|nr:sigma 54-interacting transcriptional regulator [Deltaproteobacteria bacterium]